MFTIRFSPSCFRVSSPRQSCRFWISMTTDLWGFFWLDIFSKVCINDTVQTCFFTDWPEFLLEGLVFLWHFFIYAYTLFVWSWQADPIFPMWFHWSHLQTGFLEGHQANSAFIVCGPPGFTALALINLGAEARTMWVNSHLMWGYRQRHVI